MNPDPHRSNLRIPAPGELAGQRVSLAGFDLTLRRAVGPGRHLRGRCTGCGHTAPVEAGYWLSRGFGSRPIGELGGRLRCVCGSLTVTLEVALGTASEDADFYLMP